MYQCQVYRKPENKARGWRCGQRSAPRDARWAEKGGGCVCGRNRVTLQQKMISTIAVQQSRETQGLELFLFQAQQQSQYRTASLLLVHLWLSCILCYGQKAFHRKKLLFLRVGREISSSKCLSSELWKQRHWKAEQLSRCLPAGPWESWCWIRGS